MEKKIIQLTKNDEGNSCLLCGNKNGDITFKVNRVKYDDSVISFNICDECLAKVQRDIEVCQ